MPQRDTFCGQVNKGQTNFKQMVELTKRIFSLPLNNNLKNKCQPCQIHWFYLTEAFSTLESHCLNKYLVTPVVPCVT